MEFDYETQRCYDCDGKLRHFNGCPWYTGEPVLSLRARLAVQDMVSSGNPFDYGDPYIEWNEQNDYP